MDQLLKELSEQAREYQELNARMTSPELKSKDFMGRLRLRRERNKASRDAIRLASRAVGAGYTQQEIGKAVLHHDLSADAA